MRQIINYIAVFILGAAFSHIVFSPNSSIQNIIFFNKKDDANLVKNKEIIDNDSAEKINSDQKKLTKDSVAEQRDGNSLSLSPEYILNHEKKISSKIALGTEREMHQNQQQRVEKSSSDIPKGDSNESNGSREKNETGQSSTWIGALPITKKKEENITADSDQTHLFQLIDKIGGEIGDPVFVRIFKEEKQVEVWMEVDTHYRLLVRYPLCYYPGELGPKVREDDSQVPEGFYLISSVSLEPAGSRYKSIMINYPNAYDRYHHRTGRGVRLYGSCDPVMGYGVDRKNMEEIYELIDTAIENGQLAVSLHLFPFNLTEEKMEKHSENRWYLFWRNLQQGYELFKRTKKVPRVWVKDGRYIFSSL